MISKRQQLEQWTTVVADTGDLERIAALHQRVLRHHQRLALLGEAQKVLFVVLHAFPRGYQPNTACCSRTISPPSRPICLDVW